MVSPNPMTSSRSPAPSLFKLIGGVPAEQLFRQPADALVIIGRQLELILQDDQIPADLALGTLRFSLFRLHQGRIAQLATVCRSITVYGEADVEPPQIDGVQFVALPAGAPLTQEWFLIVDSPDFWGGLLTRIVPERNDGRVRRYQFEGTLTADERTISRAMLLLSLVRQQAAPPATAERNQMTQAMRWARVAYALYTHSESERLNLAPSLHEFPELLELLTACARTTPATFEQQALPVALQALQRCHPDGDAIYRLEQEQLVPVVWHSPQQPPPFSIRSGLAAQVCSERSPITAALTATSPEQVLMPHAHAVTAVPLFAKDALWGILYVGHPDPAQQPSDVSATAARVGALLSEVLTVLDLSCSVAEPPDAFGLPDFGLPSSYASSQPYAPPAPAAPPRMPSAPPAMPSAPAPSAAPTAARAPLPAMPPAPTGGAGNGMVIPKLTPPSSPASGATPLSAGPPQPVAGDTSAFGLPAWMRSGGGMLPPPAARGGNSVPPAVAAPPPDTSPLPDASWNDLQRRLMSALVAFDRRTAEYLWEETVAQYRAEEICVELLMPVQIAIGEGWHRGEVSVAAEHFASRFVEIKMLNLLHQGHDNPTAPLAVIGCAQAEQHEIGAIMLALFMRWAGFRIIYLGQNVPNSTLADMIRQLRPKLLGLSATTVEAAHNLTEVGHILSRLEPPVPQFIFGGMAFYERPDLIGRIQGMYLDGDVRSITRQLAEMHGVRK